MEITKMKEAKPQTSTVLDTHGTLLNFEPFGSPQRKLNENALKLKRLKEHLILYRALDAEEWRKQDRRTWRRPPTFAIGQAERTAKFSAADQARAVMEGELEFDLTGGPRGLLKALSAATSTPFVPPNEKDKEREREALAASMISSNVGSNDGNNIESLSSSNDATAGGHIISEVELRQVRKQFKEMVQRQREAEARAQTEMFEDVRSSSKEKKQPAPQPHVENDEEDFLTPGASLIPRTLPKPPQQEQKQRATKKPVAPAPAQSSDVPSYAASKKSPRASSARKVVKSDEAAEMDELKQQQQQQQVKKTVSSTLSPTRATTSLAELAHESTSGQARQPRFFSIEPPKTPTEKQWVSRSRVQQFNAYRSNGITGMPRVVRATTAPSSSSYSPAHHYHHDDDDFVSQDSGEEDGSRQRRRAAAANVTPRGGVSAHPTLSTDAATKMFHRAHESETELERRTEEIAKEEAMAAASHAKHHQQHHQRRAANDPIIEVSDPFSFLVESAASIRAGSNNQAAAFKRVYSMSLQEKLLSLAASHAGVSLNAASAPNRVLGVRPPTAEAHEHHRQQQQLQQQQARQLSLSARGAAKAAASLDDTIVSATDTLDGKATTASLSMSARRPSPRVVSSVGNLNASLGSAPQQQQQAQKKQQQQQHQQQQQQTIEKQTGEFCAAKPLPFGRAGPTERNIFAVVMRPPTNERQQRSLCANVHAASRTPSCASYRPAPLQFSRTPINGVVRSIRAASNAGLSAPVSSWNYQQQYVGRQ